MSRVVLLAFTLVAFAAHVTPQAVSIFDGLAAAGASKFAQLIESDPALLALYTSGCVRSVFAPADDAVDLFNCTDGRLSLRPRQSTGDVTPAGEYQSSNDASSAASLGIVPGQVSTQNLPAAGANKKQVVTSHPATNSTNSTSSKNTLESRQQPATSATLFSGLGNSVSIVKADTPFDGGLIQTVDG